MSAITPLITPHLLSHGTIECADIARTRRFYEEFLGIDVIRPLPEAQYIWKGGPWSVVCVNVGAESKDQGIENRFELTVADAAALEAAHAAALARQQEFGIKQVLPIQPQHDGVPAFMLQDLDNSWWEISTRTMAQYDQLFAKGDCAA